MLIASPPIIMNVNFYNTEKRINSLYMDDVPKNFRRLDVQIRGNISIINPVFIVTSPSGEPTYFDENYCWVEKWNRYYFIDNVRFDGNITYIECSEDVLMSWQDEILNSTFYCLRSTSDYDESLTDNLFPAIADVQAYSHNMDNPWEDITEGTYVVAIASGDNDVSKVGTNVYYLLSTEEMTEFMDALMSKAELSITGLVDNLVKTMVNPLQYIRSCYWFPMQLKCSTISSDQIHFSWWSAECENKSMWLTENSDAYTHFQVYVEYSENIFETSFDKRKYQKFAPYSKYILTAYPFGSFELPNALIAQWQDGKTIEINVWIDHVTGMGEFIVQIEDLSIPYILTTAQVGIEIPIGEVLQNYAGAFLDIGKSFASAFSGNVIGAVSGIGNAIQDTVPVPTVQGTAGGFAQLMLDKKWNITRYFQPNFPKGDLKGEPCCDDKVVKDLRGFAKFSEVEIEGEMLRSEKEMIKNLLEEGVFVHNYG